jgi:hypothetical protein
MPSFPLMTDIPPLLSTKGWIWSQVKNAGHPSDGHWLATDTEGRRWLTKLRGSFYAYREITFAKLRHEFVIIDNEQMFSTGPSSFESSDWVRHLTGAAYSKGLALAAETCADVASITTSKLTQALSIPDNVRIDQRWPIAPKIKRAIKFASLYARTDT